MNETLLQRQFTALKLITGFRSILVFKAQSTIKLIRIVVELRERTTIFAPTTYKSERKLFRQFFSNGFPINSNLNTSFSPQNRLRRTFKCH